MSMTPPLLHPPIPRFLASTGNDYNFTKRRRSFHSSVSSGSNESSQSISSIADDITRSACNFRNLLWSSDGTSIVTTGADNTLRTFILPPTLLEVPTSEESTLEHPATHHLKPYSSHVHPVPIYATALSPYYKLSSPETTLILTSPSSLPIRLLSPFAPSILASYPLVDPSTEKWIAPHSLLFSMSASDYAATASESYAAGNSLQFLAGSRNQISLFDIARDRSGPMTTLATAPGNRKARRGGSLAMAGIVSCMSMSCEGVLAAGTFSRGMGLYDANGMGDTIGTWSLKDGEEGAGVTSIQWSRCGRYLVVVERGSDGMGVWDIRGMGTRLSWLNGRNASTMQRLGIALGHDWQKQNGSEHVYAGGGDGYVRVWNGIGLKAGRLESDWHWKAHDDAVSGLGVHSCGSVVATCSGSRQEPDNEQLFEDESCSIHSEENSARTDNSVRVWSLEDSTTADNG